MSLDQILMYAGAVAVCVGPLGSFLELVGETFGWPKLVAVGLRLEALGADLPKLIRGSRATKLKAEIELLKGEGPKTPRSPPPSVPPAVALLLLAGTLSLNQTACGKQALPPGCAEADFALYAASCPDEETCKRENEARRARCVEKVEAE